MVKFSLKIAASLLPIVSCFAETPQGTPPAALIEENCNKAEAILAGRIISTRTPTNGFRETRFGLTQVYRGPFHPGEQVTYYSFRESAERSKSELNTQRIIFLVSKTDSVGKKWGTATDFAEFTSTPALQHQVKACGRRHQ